MSRSRRSACRQATDVDVVPGARVQAHRICDRATPVASIGGEASNEEMCLDFMMYWPWVPSETCGIL
jgi:copper type II ascorbate-dependent monooxygenase-like protein